MIRKFLAAVPGQGFVQPVEAEEAPAYPEIPDRDIQHVRASGLLPVGI